MSILRAEYENGSGAFVQQIDYLVSKGYNGVRRSRGDGNCFYRCTSMYPIVPSTLFVPLTACTSPRIRLR